MNRPSCDCARGWMCSEHAGRPLAHDRCAGAGEPCHSPICPYWQRVVGARILALEAAIQFDDSCSWAEDTRLH